MKTLLERPKNESRSQNRPPEKQGLNTAASLPVQRQSAQPSALDRGQHEANFQEAFSRSSGLPAQLRSGVEQLSGISMDGVQVHYNSEKPASIQAHAYTQGSNIYVGPGQQQHLPHEAWHVVQQKQGRVQPTIQAKGLSFNAEKSLEDEANRKGQLALEKGNEINLSGASGSKSPALRSSADAVIQMEVDENALSRLRYTVNAINEDDHFDIVRFEPIIEKLRKDRNLDDTLNALSTDEGRVLLNAATAAWRNLSGRGHSKPKYKDVMSVLHKHYGT